MARGDLNVKIGADTQPLEQGLTKSKALLLGFAGGIGAVVASQIGSIGQRIGQTIGESIKLGLASEGIEKAFANINQPSLLDNLRKATQGAVSDLELMKAAVNANNYKIPLDQLGTFLKFAATRAKETGQSVDYMVNSIVIGVARKSLPILDNLGLNTSLISKEFEKTGNMAQAVGNLIAGEMGKAVDTSGLAATKVDQFRAGIENLKKTIGSALVPIINDLAESLRDAVNWLVRNTESIIELGRIVFLTARNIAVGTAAYYAAVGASKLYTLWVNRAVYSNIALHRSLVALKGALVSSGIGVFVVALGGAVAMLERYIDKAKKASEETAKLLKEKQEGAAMVKPMKEAATAVTSLDNALKSGQITRKQYNQSVQELYAKASSAIQGFTTAASIAVGKAKFDAEDGVKYWTNYKNALDTIFKGREKETDQLPELTTRYDALKQELEKLNAQVLVEIANKSAASIETSRRIRSLEAELAAINAINEALRSTPQRIEAKPADAGQALSPYTIPSDAPAMLDTRPTEMMNEATQALIDTNSRLYQSYVAIGQAVDTLAAAQTAASSAFQAGVNGEINSLKELGLVIYRTAREAIAGEIAVGIAAAVKSALKDVPFPANIIAAATAGAAAGALFSTLVPKLAEGGLAYAPTMAIVGDNPNAKSDPEVIAPLSKLVGMLRKQGGDVTVRGRLVGNDIYITNEKQYNRIQRINGF
jgi:glutaredoxin 2